MLNGSTSVLEATWKKLTDSKKSDEESSRILTALNSLLSFRNTLSRKIGSALNDADRVKAAQQDMGNIMGPIINQEITRRQGTVKNFGATISLIGEAL